MTAILRDPDFLGLPTKEKRKFLLSVDPDFAGLPIPEQSKFIESLTAPPTPKVKGFTESAFAPLGVSGPTEAGRNIAKSARLLVGLVPEQQKFWTGAGELTIESLKGAGRYAQTLGKTALAATPLGFAYQGATGQTLLPKPEEITAPVGGQELATGFQQLGRKEYAGAIGSFTAALVEALPFLGRKPLVKAAGKAAETFEPVAEGARLASGERLPTTLGIASGKPSIRAVEKLAGQVWGGGAIRRQAASLRQAASNLIDRIAVRTARRAGAVGLEAIGVPGDTYELAGKTFRQDLAGPLYREIDAAMSSPGAAIPAAKTLREFAARESARLSMQRLLTQPDVASSVKSAIERMAETPLGTEIPAPVRTLEAGPAGIFRAFQDSLSDLKTAQRVLRVKKDWNGVRLTGEMVDRLTEEMEGALRETNPDLVPKFREANALTAQGYAMHHLADILKEQTKGTKPGVMTGGPGVGERPMKISGRGLVESLKEVEESGTLRRAIPTAADAKTLQQVAELLDRAEESGSIAAKFANLGIMRMAALPLLGAWYGGAGLAGKFLVGEVTGAWIVSKALASPSTARVLMQFLKAAPNSAAELSLGVRLNKLVKTDEKNVK